jgi:hypothetical protein
MNGLYLKTFTSARVHGWRGTKVVSTLPMMGQPGRYSNSRTRAVLPDCAGIWGCP